MPYHPENHMRLERLGVGDDVAVAGDVGEEIAIAAEELWQTSTAAAVRAERDARA